MIQTRWTALAVLLLAALFLAGCGGGGGGDGSVRQDLEAQVEALMAERDAALQARQTAETAQIAAEEAEAAAKAAQAVAETARTAAETARAAAEAERDTAQAAELAAKATEAEALADLADAQAAEMAAKAAQAVAETARQAAETARAAAEAERDTAQAAGLAAKAAEAEAVAAQAEAEAAQAVAVAAELAAKAAQTAAEAARDTALKAKAAAEAARDEARDGGTQAKIDLIAAESAQALAERERDRAEAAKTEAEQAQAAAETARQEAETAKIAAEAAKTAAETARTAAETAKTVAEADVARLTGELTAANAKVARLTGELTTANAEVARLTDEIGDTTEADSLTARLAAAQAEVTTLRGRLRVSQDEVASLRRQLQDAQGDLATERERADDAEDRAQQVQQQGQAQEASQRAKNLEGVLNADVPTNSSSPVTFDLTTRGRVKLTHGRSSATLSGSGLRSSTMSLTGAGATGKTVVYTDVELSRSVVEHYLPGQNTTRLAVDAQYGDLTTNNVIPENSADWKVSHGFRTTITGTATDQAAAEDDPEAKRTSSYGGSLHGVSGRFVCTGTNCRVQVAPEYDTDPNNANNRVLQRVTLNSVNAQGQDIDDGEVFFVSSGSVSLYVDGPVEEDKEYMVFGYWREDPASPAGVYKFDVFAAVIGDEGTVPANITATYDGTAVGAYAEKDPGTAVETWRQGEFTANVGLTATSGNVYGTIDDFVTRPTGGSTAPKTVGLWRVDLGDAAGTTANNAPDGTLRLPQMAGSQTDGDGTWAHAFVSSRQTTGGVPPTVAGTFKASIQNSLTLLGAFGATKR